MEKNVQTINDHPLKRSFLLCFLLVILGLSSPELANGQSGCAMGCSGTNITLDPTCETTAQHIFEAIADPSASCVGPYVIVIKQGSTILYTATYDPLAPPPNTGPIFNGADVAGEMVVIEITSDNGNGTPCWTDVLIEDKTPPEIIECVTEDRITCADSLQPAMPFFISYNEGCCSTDDIDTSWVNLGKINGFNNYFAPDEWATMFNPASSPVGSSLFTGGALVLTGADGGTSTSSGLACANLFANTTPGGVCQLVETCITIKVDGEISFDWLLEMAPGSAPGLFPNGDPAAYAVNGVYTQLSNPLLSGDDVTVPVSAGDVFCFVIGSNDSEVFSQATYSDFMFTPEVDPNDAGATVCGDYCFIREWTITDCNGMSDVCCQKVTVTRPDISTGLTPPVNHTGQGALSLPALQCDEACGPADPSVFCGVTEGWAVIQSGPFAGHPSPYDELYPCGAVRCFGTGEPLLNGQPISDNCMIVVNFTDEIIEQICENSYKLLRTWTVVDWCDNRDPGTAPIRFYQTIKVLDEEGPELTCPDDLTISTDNRSCTGVQLLDLPTNIEDQCSSLANIDLSISEPTNTVLFTEIQTVGGTRYLASNLPLGVSVITYTATDDCGNSNTCSFSITVEDQVCPDVVGDDGVTVNINFDGTTTVDAVRFDEGSTDNCSSILSYKVIRINHLDGTIDGSDNDQQLPGCVIENGDDDDNAITGNQVYFDDQVTFCCTDIGGVEDSVIFRVFDAAVPAGPIDPTFMAGGKLVDVNGQLVANYCDVRLPVDVQDNFAPIVTDTLPDITVSCIFMLPTDSAGYDATFGTYVSDPADQKNIIINDPDNNVNTPQPFLWGTDGLVVDNCNDAVVIRSTITENITTCNTGTITRTFTIASGNGAPIIRIQTITIEDFDPFDPLTDITWVGNITLDQAVVGCNPDLTNLGRPTIINDACSKAAAAIDPSEEREFSQPDLGVGMCKKILRKWEVRDWCQPDLIVCNPNLIDGVQEILIINNVPPVVNCPTFDPADLTVDPVTGTLTIDFNPLVSTTDDCGVQDTTIVISTLNNNGSFSEPSDGVGVFMPGTYQLEYTATDSCGNVASCMTDFEITEDACNFVTSLRDIDLIDAASLPRVLNISEIYSGTDPAIFDIPGIGAGTSVDFDCDDIDYSNYPTRYDGEVVITTSTGEQRCPVSLFVQDTRGPLIGECVNPSPIELDPVTNSAVVNLADVQPTVFSDNCSGASDIVFSLTPIAFTPPMARPAATTSITVNCSDLNASGRFNVTVYAVDLAGQQSTCSVSILFIEAPGVDNCLNAVNISANIAGQIFDEESQLVQDVKVELKGAASNEVMSNQDGQFNFEDLAIGEDYTLQAVKDNDDLNGVSTYDLVVMSRHILELDDLESPYKMVAADVNKDGKITAYDMVELRKVLLYINTEFPNNTSWRFIDANFLFPNSGDPFSSNFPEVYEIEDLSDNMIVDFVAVKTGDVNCSAKTNRLAGSEDRNAVGTLTFGVQEMDVKAGEVYEVPFTMTEDQELMGYQFTLDFDAEVLDFAGLTAAELPGLGEGNFGQRMAQDGAITTSWNAMSGTELKAGQGTFTLKFRAKRDGKLSELLTASSRFTTAEAYNRNGDLLDVNLAFGADEVSEQFALFQNRPNPFRSETLVGFVLPESGMAKLTIYDVSGKLISVVEDNFDKGYNEININRSDLSNVGVLYYQLETATHSAVRKMTIID